MSTGGAVAMFLAILLACDGTIYLNRMLTSDSIIIGTLSRTVVKAHPSWLSGAGPV
jgi:hypothetical protein